MFPDQSSLSHLDFKPFHHLTFNYSFPRLQKMIFGKNLFLWLKAVLL